MLDAPTYGLPADWIHINVACSGCGKVITISMPPAHYDEWSKQTEHFCWSCTAVTD